MIYLIGSIVLTSYLTLSFKVLERFRIPVLQAIVCNYFICVVVGSFINGSIPFADVSRLQPWVWWAMLMGSIFIILFNIIGFTAQRLGVAVASVSNKLSLVIPFVFSIVLYHEKASWLSITGIIIALLSVLLTCFPSKRDPSETGKPISLALKVLLPAILFIGSGLLDTMIKFVEEKYLNASNQDAYLITAFTTAGLIGGLILLIRILAGKERFDKRSIIAGIMIGIPNYLSIWCLVTVLKQNQGESSTIIPINNMGIVLFSSVVAWLLFREKLSFINWVGILLSLAAIALIAFG